MVGHVQEESDITRIQSEHEIWMLTLYDKSERSTIPGHTLKQIAETVKHDKS